MESPKPGSRRALTSAGCCRTWCSLPCPIVTLLPLSTQSRRSLSPQQPSLGFFSSLAPRKLPRCDTLLWSSLLSSASSSAPSQ